MVFRSKPNLDQLNLMSKGNMVEHLGIEFTAVGDDFIEATMPVDSRTKQPFGLLHGGASVVLAETLGSVAGAMTVDTQKQLCVGLEINANHLKSVTEGKVTGKASPIHVGKSTQVWEIKIFNEAKTLCCISRITLAILDRK